MSSLPTDPYKILGVSKDAQIPEIRSAHRKLVLKCHPDKVQDPALKAQKQDEFQKVQQAYEILSDETQRQKYDELAAKQARLAELLRATQGKGNSSSPRANATFKYEVYTTDRPSSFKSGTSPNARVYASYSRSFDDELGRSPPFEPERTVRREASYPDRSSKRETEREREYRKRRDEAARRAEKEKEAKRAEKKAREKEREKERRRETEDKRRHAKPAYVEEYGIDDVPTPIVRTSEKKKTSSSKKHEKRDRSSHREEAPPVTDSQSWGVEEKSEFAKDYIKAVRQKSGVSHARHILNDMPPAVPTPPPAQSSPFPAPAAAAAADEDDARRSAAKPRRGSSGAKSFRTASRESLDADVINVVNVSPGRGYRKSASAIPPAMAGSPPRLPRMNSAPINSEYTRPIPIRSKTFNVSYGTGPPRGRGRSNLHPQMEESASEDEYEPRHHNYERRRRGSKKNHSPEREREERVKQYRMDKGHVSLQTSYTRHVPAGSPDAFSYYESNAYSSDARRPMMPYRESSFDSAATSTAHYTKYKTSKAYGPDDVNFSEGFDHHGHHYPRDSGFAYGLA